MNIQRERGPPVYGNVALDRTRCAKNDESTGSGVLGPLTQNKYSKARLPNRTFPAMVAAADEMIDAASIGGRRTSTMSYTPKRTPHELRTDPRAIATNPYVGKTAWVERPSVPDDRALDPASLDRLRDDEARWDEARDLEADNKRAFDDRVAAIETRKEAEAKARQEAGRVAMLAPAKAQYLADGGTEEDWPELEAQLWQRWRAERAYRALEGDDPALEDARAVLGYQKSI